MDKLSRRRFFRWGLGTTGTLIASQAWGQVCEEGKQTAIQPLGPFFPQDGSPKKDVREDEDNQLPIHLANDNDLTFVKGHPGTAKGQIVYVKGVLSSKDCKPIKGATIIAWQASSTGQYNHTGDDKNADFIHPKTGQTIHRELDENFQYWGKAITNENGEYSFKTIVPGFYPADLDNQWYRPPHIHMLVRAMGHENLVTQMYFSGKDIHGYEFIDELNQKDFLLQNPNLSKEQKKNLIVDFKVDPEGAITDGLVGTFNISLND